MSLFKALEEVPDSKIGRAWALDHLTVAFRNSAILLLANDGEYHFSFRQILNRLQKRGKITPDGLIAIQKLRSAKRAYRLNATGSESSEYLYAALKATTRALSIDIDSKLKAGICTALDCDSVSSTSAYLYMRNMRSVERELISAMPATKYGQIKRARLLHLVRRPHDYLWQAMHEKESIEFAVADLRSHVRERNDATSEMIFA